MNLKSAGIIVLNLLFFFNTYALDNNEVENKFKDITKQIAVDFQGELSAASAPGKEENVVIETNLVDCRNELKGLIKTNPESIWADDAQYIIAILNTANPRQEALELEYLLKEYPDMHIEDWTRETLPILMPNSKIPFEIVVRLQLCLDYKQSGDTEKLKQIYYESVKKYPDKAKIFEKFLYETSPILN